MSIQDSNSSVVVPTMDDVRKAIKEAIEEHAASRNHPYATQVEPGFVTLSNETDSDSEITVATSKAVKKAYDLANTANQNVNSRLEKNQNGEDIPDKTEFVKNIGLSGTVELARNSVQGKQYIYDLTYATAAWVKIAEVTMGVPSTININLIGGSGYNVGLFGQCAITNIVLRTGNNNPHGINAVMYTTNSGAPTNLVIVNTSGDNYDIYIFIGAYAQSIILNAFASVNATVNKLSNIANFSEAPKNAVKGKIYSYSLVEKTPN
ncbi:phage tail protein [Xenorhabdus bovienii]|uniref:Phage tail protein n=1 Tax=Xenorhabdus bovienii TaxID=40576 RepID=A0AAJ1N4J6_XENBV|nr:phage tail protein [Xenorhabdus bovienii]MDE1479036.1 phage tail protein [Xenorhabdus bovienii]MDE9510743.1 phage tail protein [Xenorhabdus bovienii]MDE9522348.1 phage tail protein [Xenorhabdus bovienii]